MTDGLLDVSYASEEYLVLDWNERGAPPSNRPVGAPGYRSTLVSRVIATELGGSIHRDWADDGVVITIRLDKQRLAR